MDHALNLKENVLRRETLNEADLAAVMEGRATALIVSNYVNPTQAMALSKRMVESGELAQYTHEYTENGERKREYFGVDRFGTPFNSVYGHAEGSFAYRKYFDDAKDGIRNLRKLAAPYLSPIDKFRLDLDEVWSYGAQMARFLGKQMLIGIGRSMKAETSILSEVEPHFDALPEIYADLKYQLAANIYLEVPERGGALEIWDIDPLYAGYQPPKQWRAKLPASTVIHPKAGDLIIFNCRKPHAVRAFEEGMRTTVQTFIGVRPDHKLVLWN